MTTQIKTKPKPQATSDKKGDLYDLIIVGGGPAGLTAALYALRSKLRVLLVERMVLGGVVSSTFQIENYPGFPEPLSGLDFSNRLQEQVKKLGLEVVWGNVAGVGKKPQHFITQADGKVLKSKTVLIATGTEAAKLGVPGESELRGRGVSYCATCDGPFYKDKNIAVVGGGNSAIEEALFLTRYAKKVFIIHRRDELRADKVLAERAMAHPKIYFLWHSTLEEIIGQEKVTGVILKDLNAEKKSQLALDGVFIYVGSQANSGFLKNKVKLDKNGFIITDENMKTSIEGLFAAGDIRAKSLRQIVTAVADGAIAADQARAFIEH